MLGATLDGNSVNRRLIKLHNPKEEVYKVRNPFTLEKRDLFFIADPPHLIKTVRNCWQSKCHHLWVKNPYTCALLVLIARLLNTCICSYIHNFNIILYVE